MEPAPQAKDEPQKPAEEKKGERGFFGRLLDRITPGSSAEAKPEPAAEPVKPAAEVKAQEQKPVEPKAEEQTPVEEKKERGFFGRMLERIGL